jgi:hypothetical protein
MTRRLGIRYLWIDSLCIIQDNTADWERESGNMANIYQKSYLTLAAAASSSGSGGLFVDRDGEFVEIHLPQTTLSKPPSIRARRERPHRALNPMIECDPLSTRAWAYQERLLARRIVHFSSEELLWECRTKEACECGGKWNYFDEIKFGSEKARYENMLSRDNRNANGDPWHQLVQVYTQLRLTFEDDRLPALSGIASQLFRESQYLAGLRRDHFIKDLFWVTSFWKTHPKAALTRRRVKYRAPSWSWASVEAPVQWYNWIPKGDQSYAIDGLKIIEASCTPTGNPFGRVSDGHLIISGVVLEATLLPLAVSTANLESHEPQISYENSVCHPTRNLCWGTFYPDYTAFQSCYLSPQSISLLVAGRDAWTEFDHHGTIVDQRAVMFVLKKCPREETVFERIGWAEYKGQRPFDGYNGALKRRVVKII